MIAMSVAASRQARLSVRNMKFDMFALVTENSGEVAAVMSL